MGSVRLMVCVLGLTLFAMPNELWKLSTFTNSREKVGGSPAALVQVIVAGPPLLRLDGVLIVSALTSGSTRARRLCHAKVNMVVGGGQASTKRT